MNTLEQNTLDTFLGSDERKLHIRMTTNKMLDEIKEFLGEHLTPTKMLISEEGVDIDHKHYHALVCTTVRDDASNSKLRKLINKVLGLKGNGQFSISTVRNEKQLMKYLLKEEGNYYAFNFPDELINLMMLCSSKKGKQNIAMEIAANEELYLGGKQSFSAFYCRHVEIKVSYNQNIYLNHVDAYALKIMVKKTKCAYTIYRMSKVGDFLGKQLDYADPEFS